MAEQICPNVFWHCFVVVTFSLWHDWWDEWWPTQAGDNEKQVREEESERRLAVKTKRNKEERMNNRCQTRTRNRKQQLRNTFYSDNAFIQYLFGDTLQFVCGWRFFLCYLVSSCLFGFYCMCCFGGKFESFAFSPPRKKPCCREQQDKRFATYFSICSLVGFMTLCCCSWWWSYCHFFVWLHCFVFFVHLEYFCLFLVLLCWPHNVWISLNCLKPGVVWFASSCEVVVAVSFGFHWWL